MYKKNHIFALLLTIACLSMTACKEEEKYPLPAPISDFTHYPEYPSTNENLTFKNLSERAVSYEWVLGDGTTSTDPSPSHRYNAPGRYNVTLIAKNLQGVTTKKTTTIAVRARDASECPYDLSDYTGLWENVEIHSSYGRHTYRETLERVNPTSVFINNFFDFNGQNLFDSPYEKRIMMSFDLSNKLVYVRKQKVGVLFNSRQSPGYEELYVEGDGNFSICGKMIRLDFRIFVPSTNEVYSSGTYFFNR
ncbi:MAG: PKD domain-containing protein [Bernardetiaceae bacterium]|nr:PKD domain-containing protein [Bernardetiaceae bacterium]